MNFGSVTNMIFETLCENLPLRKTSYFLDLWGIPDTFDTLLPHQATDFPRCRIAINCDIQFALLLKRTAKGLSVAVVTHSPLTSEVGGSNPRPYGGKLVVAYRWSSVYSTEP